MNLIDSKKKIELKKKTVKDLPIQSSLKAGMRPIVTSSQCQTCC